MHEYGEEWLHSAPRALVEYAIENEAQQPGEEVVIVSQVLAASVNLGYQGTMSASVRGLHSVVLRALL